MTTHGIVYFHFDNIMISGSIDIIKHPRIQRMRMFGMWTQALAIALHVVIDTNYYLLTLL